MSTDTANELLIGAKGWDHESWQNHFYPDDLPEDWRLTYYANEFQTVLVPEADWIGAETDVIEQWLDDTYESFVFYFEISLNTLQLTSSSLAINQLLTVFDQQSEQLGALIVNIPIEHNTDDLHSITQTYPENLAIILNYPAQPATASAPNKKLKTDTCWHKPGDNNDVNATSKRHNVGFIDTTTNLPNKELRCQLEQYQSKINPLCPTALFLYGDPPDISNLRDIKMIKELIMG